MFCVATLTEASSFEVLHAVSAWISAGTNTNVVLCHIVTSVVSSQCQYVTVISFRLAWQSEAFVWIAYLVNVLHSECPHCTQKLFLLMKVVVFACISMLQRQLTLHEQHKLLCAYVALEGQLPL